MMVVISYDVSTETADGKKDCARSQKRVSLMRSVYRILCLRRILITLLL